MTTIPPQAIKPEGIPEEWVKAAEDHYSMHGAGLVRNIIAGVAPLIRAAEKERITRIADELEASVPQSRVDGVVLSTFSFADVLRGEES